MMPTRAQELAVVRAVTYAGLFDYPLTPEQLRVSLGVPATADAVEAWWQHSEWLQSVIGFQNGWFYPYGRHDLVATRTRREAISRTLIARHARFLKALAALPFIRTAALSGSLAHLNAERGADLDLFIVTAAGHVWSVTVMGLVLAKLLGVRKRVCLNYVISEDALDVEPRDMFSANQIINLRPLFGDRVFSRFVQANRFVRDHYPNFELAPAPPVFARPTLTSLVERVASLGPAQLLERACRTGYGWHLRRRSAGWTSREQVRLEAECLKLHTSSHRAATVDKFERAMALATEPATFTKDLKVLAS